MSNKKYRRGKRARRGPYHILFLGSGNKVLSRGAEHPVTKDRRNTCETIHTRFFHQIGNWRRISGEPLRYNSRDYITMLKNSTMVRRLALIS